MSKSNLKDLFTALAAFLHESGVENHKGLKVDLVKFFGGFGDYCNYVDANWLEIPLAYSKQQKLASYAHVPITDMERTACIEDMLFFDGGYGVNQGYFEESDSFISLAVDDEKISLPNVDKFIKKGACGPSAAITVSMYIQGIREVTEELAVKRMLDYFEITDNIYVNILRDFPFICENDGGEAWYALETYFACYGRETHAYRVNDYESDLPFIKVTLESMPVILAFPGSMNIVFYDENGRSTFKEGDYAHFVVISAVYENDTNTYLEVYSWGKKYYIDWNEILATNFGLLPDYSISYLVFD